MPQDGDPKKKWLPTWFLDSLPKYLLLFVLIGCIVAASLALLGQSIGYVFSNIYISSDPFCSGGAKVRAWLDKNGNGKWEANESPLPNVRFSIADDQATSDWKGEASGSIMTGCRSNMITISALSPVGYRLTTAASISVAVNSGMQGPFLFGFTYLPGVPTVTPRPPAPTCTSYLRDHQGNSHVAIAPDGKIWASIADFGVFQYDPARDEWKDYTPNDSLMRHATSIAIGQNGNIWIGMWDQPRGGAARFDGSTWTTYSYSDGLASNGVLQVTAAPDGSIWFVTVGKDVSRFDPKTNAWTTYTQADGLDSDWVETAKATPDGSVWFGTYDGVSRWIPGNTLVNRGTWKTYHTSVEMPPVSNIWDIIVARDGTLWFAGQGGIAHVDPARENWTFHPYEDNFMSMAQAADGSLWLGTSSHGVKHLIPAVDADGRDIWEIYTTADGLSDDYVTSVAVAADNSIWFGTFHGITHCVFSPTK